MKNNNSQLVEIHTNDGQHELNIPNESITRILVNGQEVSATGQLAEIHTATISKGWYVTVFSIIIITCLSNMLMDAWLVHQQRNAVPPEELASSQPLFRLGQQVSWKGSGSEKTPNHRVGHIVQFTVCPSPKHNWLYKVQMWPKTEDGKPEHVYIREGYIYSGIEANIASK